MPPKAKNISKGKKRGLDRNVSLENRLIELGVDEDELFGWSREEQSAELERREGRAPRTHEMAFEELITDARVRNSIPLPATAEVEIAEVADTAPPAEQIDINTAADHPMEIDEGETVNRLIPAAELVNNENEWLLQQPTQMPIIAGQLAAEAVEILHDLLDPIDDQTREKLTNMPYEQQITSLQQILDDQWTFLNTPPPYPMRSNPLASIPADLRPIASQLPLHLQDLLAGTNEYAQRMVLGFPELEMYRQLYRGLSTRRLQNERYNQEREHLRRQIDLDPLLSLNMFVRRWLQGTSNSVQRNYLASGSLERYSMLQDNGMLIHIGNWGARTAPPIPTPDHLRTAEQIAMQSNNYTDYQAWLYSTARMDWMVWVIRNGSMEIPTS
ncbi:hypothetical protein QM012_002511 [Aureobasidium pullulans]|uniref:Uncharacterized protein n=1 Tax=Aureobasidium pullulans TaxID=5580 RepID=A0ABR0TDB2_AURPU